MLEGIPMSGKGQRLPKPRFTLSISLDQWVVGPGPYLELFARGARKGWVAWGHQADAYEPTWTYPNHFAAGRRNKAATLFDV
jgi:hypothetical protein